MPGLVLTCGPLACGQRQRRAALQHVAAITVDRVAVDWVVDWVVARGFSDWNLAVWRRL